MDGAIRADSTGFGERGGISTIRFDRPCSKAIHRRVVRIGDDDLIAEALEVRGDPFAFGEGVAEDGCKSFAARGYAPFRDVTGLHNT
jgi:hypothetical protein